MIITIYELLGLIKDGKAPKKIKWQDEIYTFVYKDTINKDYDYQNKYGDYLFCDMIDAMYLSQILNDKVEILEENKPIIEKLKVKDNKVIGKWENGSDYRYTLSAPQVVIINKINEVIDYLNKKEG